MGKSLLIAALLVVCSLTIGILIGSHRSNTIYARHNSLLYRYPRLHSLSPSDMKQRNSFFDFLPTGSAPNGCQPDLQQWVAWRDQQISQMLKPTYQAADGETLLDRDQVDNAALSAFTLLDACIQANPSLFDASTDLGKAMGPFYRFVGALHWMALKDSNGHFTHQLGFTIPDSDVWAYAKDHLVFPDLLKSSAFLNAMAAPSGYKAAVQMILDRNVSAPSDVWDVLPFKARFITTVDQATATYGRLLVVVHNVPETDGGTTDKWILFGMLTPDMDQTIKNQNVSMFSVHTDRAGHQTTYMMDFTREPNPNGGIDIVPITSRPPGTMPSKNCYDCHKLAILPIYPDTTYGFDSAGKLVPATGSATSLAQTLNDKYISNYAAPDFGRMDMAAYGPPLGLFGRTRTDDFIKSCSNNPNLSPASLNNVRAAMKCSMCHDDDGNGSINYLQATHNKRDVTAFRDKVSMITTFVQNGWMPPRNSLTSDERTAVAACVVKEYYDSASETGLLVDWLQAKIP